MRFSLLLALASSALAIPSTIRHVVHEKRSSIPPGWRKSPLTLNEDFVLPIRIALKQSNLDRLEDHLMEVSHPESASFGQHWTSEKIAETFAPSQETHTTVRQWLESAGIFSDRITVPASKGWIHFDATVAEAEQLFKTKYHFYEHDSGSTNRIGCDEYHVPAHVQPHVDFMTPSVHFDGKTPPVTKAPSKRNARRGIANGIGHPGNAFLPKQGAKLPAASNVSESYCQYFITPDCLRTLYQIPVLSKSIQTNGYGIVEYTPQAYVPLDLVEFFAVFSPNQKQLSPTLKSIDGGFAQQTNMSFDYNGESDLDLEYAMTLVNPVPVSLFQVGDPYESGSFNNFLDALDATYCGGDDPTQDSVYPDRNYTGQPGAYEGPETCGAFKATSVISTSYGYNEADLTPAYEMRQCNEYAKLGMLGSTILYSSGDYGVAGNGGQCIDPVTGMYNNGTSGKFNPSFPGGCPYVTSVGATQIPPGGTPTGPEEACETVIYSGGGFSNVFPMPSYQKAAVAHYYANYNPPYGADRYNNSRMVRGFPDVSANGANYIVVVDGEPSLVYGTSCSSPVFGSVITIVNEARAKAGKATVGFLNPTLYAHPSVLHDIVSGGNQGCGTPGFTAVPGWDPVTGLGTPDTEALIKLFLSLP